MQKYVKFSSLSYHTLKPPPLLTHRFKENNNAQEKFFKHMCIYGEREVWINGRISDSSYLDVDTKKYQYHMINPKPFDCITG